MPAINAAANPVNTVTSPSASSGGISAASTSSGERPFATVLAEQKGKAPKAGDKDRAPSAPDKAAPAADGEAETAALATVPPPAPDGQGPIPPVVVTGQEGADVQAQAAAELIQAVLTAAGTVPNPVQPDATGMRQAKGTVALATANMEAAPTIAGEPGIGLESSGESIADMRLAVARNAHGETPADDGSMPAKLAATRDVFAPQAEVRAAQPKEVFALTAESRAGQPTEALAAKSDAGMAQAASMAAAVTTQLAAAAAQPRHASEYHISTPVGNQHWETAVGNSLVIMSGSRHDRAELVLTPPQFGRIEVSISMKGDEATAVFVSANPAVRDALENALPRLREVLAEAGITLGQTQVGAESQGQSASDRQNGDNATRRGIADAMSDGDLQTGAGNRDNATHRIISRSLVDTYA